MNSNSMPSLRAQQLQWGRKTILKEILVFTPADQHLPPCGRILKHPQKPNKKKGLNKQFYLTKRLFVTALRKVGK
jgi:hypothetical protein